MPEEESIVIVADNFDVAKAIQERRLGHIKYAMKNDKQIAEEIIRERESPPRPAAGISPTHDLENIKKELGGFIKRSYQESWNSTPDQVAKAGEKLNIMRPQDIDWETTTDVDASKFGEYTVNPDTVGISWEDIPKEKIKVFAFTDFVGKKRWKLAKYISTEWPHRDKYHIPGIEYWKYVFENPDKAPDSLKDRNWQHFFGSIFRGADGRWRVPFVNRGGALFERNGYWLDYQWYSNDRVVLLEK